MLWQQRVSLTVRRASTVRMGSALMTLPLCLRLTDKIPRVQACLPRPWSRAALPHPGLAPESIRRSRPGFAERWLAPAQRREGYPSLPKGKGRFVPC